VLEGKAILRLSEQLKVQKAGMIVEMRRQIKWVPYHPLLHCSDLLTSTCDTCFNVSIFGDFQYIRTRQLHFISTMGGINSVSHRSSFKVVTNDNF
jgi:hypothetical protein